MRLLLSATSPYARKVHVALLEKGVPFQPAFVTAADPSVAAANPLGKVPALVRADDTVLYDSPVILQYLEVLAPAPALYPADPLARIEALRWEALGDGICDATVTRMLEGRRAPERQDLAARAPGGQDRARARDARARPRRPRARRGRHVHRGGRRDRGHARIRRPARAGAARGAFGAAGPVCRDARAAEPRRDGSAPLSPAGRENPLPRTRAPRPVGGCATARPGGTPECIRSR